jgi:hypothetical protein
MDMQNIFMQIGNALTTLLLRSPLHKIMSKSTVLIAITGHKSGHEITLPVNYFQAGDTLYITSLRGRTWWRNLRGGKPVRVWLGGHLIEGKGTAEDGYSTVFENLKNFFQNRPDITRYFGVRLETNNKPNTQDIARLAQERVLVKVCLNGKI